MTLKQDSEQKREPTWWLWRQGRRRLKPERQLSPILLRILAVNFIALAILVGSILYLGRYQDRIISTQLEAMTLQARIFSSAVTENSVVIDDSDESVLSPMLARLMVRRLAETTETRTRLFDTEGTLLADSRQMLANKVGVEIEPIAPNPEKSLIERIISMVFDALDHIHERREYPLYVEQSVQAASQYGLVTEALQNKNAAQVWRLDDGRLLLTVAVPMLHTGDVLGAVLISRNDAVVEQAIYAVRINILNIFFVTLFITLLMSIYLARAIARPIRLLAMGAEKLHQGQVQNIGLAGTAHLLDANAIPDLTAREDEIGDLSGALRNLTSALGKRITAIEHFAADVAHEIKNPLTSLRSAVETAERIKDPAAQRKLMQVIRDDVDRLDRLITDISSASRLDAELSRATTTLVDIDAMLGAVVDLYNQPEQAADGNPKIVLLLERRGLKARGIETRLVQVLQNLISNALSFSPEDGGVSVIGTQDDRFVTIMVEDRGPGIPENKLSAIFDRFYSERPRDEKFGTHSGLGLSIAKQIIEAHNGTIRAENIKSTDGRILGARFIVQLPV